MWKKIAIAGGICAAVAGIGTAALATSGASDLSGSSPAASGKHGDKHGAGGLRRALHAQWVTLGKDGKSFVTHDAIRGTVTAVSPTSITVQSLDKTSETFTVSSATKVRMGSIERPAKGTKRAKPTKAAITQVHAGDRAIVIGTGTTALTATGILDAGK